MKKLGLVIGILLLVAVLAGCSQTEDQSIAGQDSGANESSNTNDELEFELPDNFQLMIGIFGLEETELAVTRDQASELVPLWKAFRSLSTSDNVAAEELGAILRQIQDSMTLDQLQAITEMDLSQENILELTRELGIIPEGGAQFGRGGDFPNGAGGDGFGAGPGDAFGGGGPGGAFGGGGQGGAFGGGGPGGGFGGNFDPEAIATLRAERGGGDRFGNRAGAFLLDPLIELLELRAGN
ncbi:MAG: hypothetical protein IIC78_01140 [Chloroflexi bacterium]|nr:hypothetical protein [Chloroflexota bacterium]